MQPGGRQAAGLAGGPQVAGRRTREGPGPDSRLEEGLSPCEGPGRAVQGPASEEPTAGLGNTRGGEQGCGGAQTSGNGVESSLALCPAEERLLQGKMAPGPRPSLTLAPPWATHRWGHLPVSLHSLGLSSRPRPTLQPLGLGLGLPPPSWAPALCPFPRLPPSAADLFYTAECKGCQLSFFLPQVPSPFPRTPALPLC